LNHLHRMKLLCSITTATGQNEITKETANH